MGSGRGGPDEFLTMLGAVDPIPLIATPGGEFLVNQLEDFDPESYGNPVELSDNANKLLMLILAAVIKAGDEKEHGILAEIRSAVFVFLKKLAGLNVLDPALVSRVRILYVRMLLKRAPELSSVSVRPVESFLEGGSGCTRRVSAKGSTSPPASLDSVDEEGQQVRSEKFRVDYRMPGRRISFKSLWRRLKLQGDSSPRDDPWEQNCMFNRLVKVRDQARTFAIGNKKLAALVAHSQPSVLINQIQTWISSSFDLKSCTSPREEKRGPYGCDAELLASAIYDGFLMGLGVPQRLGPGTALASGTDAVGQLLWDYTKAVHTDRQRNCKRGNSPLRSRPLPSSPKMAGSSPKVAGSVISKLAGDGDGQGATTACSPQPGKSPPQENSHCQ